MEKWRSHVRGELYRRDSLQKDPFAGLLTSLSRSGEKVDLRDKLLDSLQSCLERNNGRGAANDDLSVPRQLALRESEEDILKLRERVRDLTASLYLKDAELQHCYAQVSRFRNEALSFGREMATLKTQVADYEYRLELQSRELRGQRLETEALRTQLATLQHDKEQLLQKWMEDKSMEAKRMNRYNRIQERCHRLTADLLKAKQLDSDAEQDHKDESCALET
ncbi:autophagy-related protein 16-1 [Engraulis encrasicolus]|uniref:autophagy-related protein 16-1 n=1 Tax=Engraulis encrasicolus TaxID=184585 RepID=UPI002FD56113